MKKYQIWAAVVIVTAAVLTLIGCASGGIKTVQTDNKDIHVTLLFEHDGCKVYRFWDAGELIYYANCGQSSDTAWNHTEGKTTYHEQVPTRQ